MPPLSEGFGFWAHPSKMTAILKSKEPSIASAPELLSWDLVTACHFLFFNGPVPLHRLSSSGSFPSMFSFGRFA